MSIRQHIICDFRATVVRYSLASVDKARTC